MNNQTRGIVVLFDGTELTERVKQHIVSVIAKNAQIENISHITMYEFDSSDIAKTMCMKSIAKSITEPNDADGLDAAITFIGIKYKKYLKGNPALFASILYSDLAACKAEVVSACKIIAKNSKYVPNHITAKNYNISEIHVDMIINGIKYLS